MENEQKLDDTQKLHWWCLSFTEGSTGGYRISTGYRSQTHQQLTKVGIDSVRSTLRCGGGVLTMCAYLGEMTREEFDHGIGSEKK